VSPFKPCNFQHHVYYIVYYIKDIRIMKSYYERKQNSKVTFVFLNGTWDPTSIKRFIFYFISFL